MHYGAYAPGIGHRYLGCAPNCFAVKMHRQVCRQQQWYQHMMVVIFHRDKAANSVYLSQCGLRLLASSLQKMSDPE